MASLELFQADWRAIWNGSHELNRVGSIYTKPDIVDTILDLAGYVSESRRLSDCRLLEPSCGDGAFLHAVVDRIIRSEQLHVSQIDWQTESLETALRAVDIDEAAVRTARIEISAKLQSCGCPEGRATILAENWIRNDDYLLSDDESRYDFVVGNPPYVRLEGLPKTVLAAYRNRYQTLTDRADLYVAFIERGLCALSKVGVLAFIVANRFTKNQYGSALRRTIGASFRVRHYINLEHTQPFLTDVSAYPCIVVVDRLKGAHTMAGELRDIGADTLASIRSQARTADGQNGPLRSFETWYSNGAPWLTTSSSDNATLNWLEENASVLESSGGKTRAGIGVATGADSVYVLDAKSSLIEDSRQIPLILAKDVRASGCNWSGHYLVNPFADEDDGSLVNLESYPGLQEYLEQSKLQLVNRHVAKSRPHNWFRTIDRIWPKWQHQTKLVIPDIQSGGVVGLDHGEFYPHHNVYWITSDAWDLRALQAVLRSSMVLMQVRAHSVQMRGGSLRYQTQTLRRLRVPDMRLIRDSIISNLIDVSTSTNQMEIDSAVEAAYGIKI